MKPHYNRAPVERTVGLDDQEKNMMIRCSSGEADINVGTEFTEWNGGKWRVVRPEQPTYSPSNIGGAMSFACEHIGGPMKHSDCAEMDGTVVFCGDSIAAMVLRG